ncbi:MAG: CoA transferase [Acidimicrobiales bacterium]
MDDGLLDGWRILDMTDRRGEVGPYLLADLGAEVLRLEPAGGDPGRRRGDGSEAVAYNGNKRSVVCSGDPVADRALVLDLVAGADVIMDSGPPGRLAGLGIGDDDVVAANPTAVVVLVTPFGSDGPRADQPAEELTIAALGGPMRIQGSPDRAPVHLSIPQVWRHAGAEAALAALVAHRRMERTGEAQFVDVSAQSVMTWTMLNAMEAQGVQGHEFERTGSEIHLSLRIQLRIDAADGYVIAVPTARSVQFLLPWLLEDGIVDDSWRDVDWTRYDHAVISGEEVRHSLDEVQGAVLALCARHTKWELFIRGLGYGATLAPLNTLADLLAFDHLDRRSFWTAEAGDGLGRRAPGACYRVDGVRPAVRRGPVAPDADGDLIRAALAAAPAVETIRDGDRPAPQPEHRFDGPPFEGLKVVDFSWIGVGPITAKALADHGATVIRIESENRIDGLRLQPPFKDGEPGINRSNFYGTFNTSKLSVALDLKTAEGRMVARRLADWADVVIESFTPGTIDRLGFGYRALVTTNPSLVMVSTSLLGEGSEVSSMAGYGYHAAAVAGFQDLIGWPDRGPDGPWVAYTDTICPRFITPTLLAALHRRRRTGEGCHIEAAQLEVALQLLAPELRDVQRDGMQPPRRGNRSPDLAPRGAYPTRGDDRWIAIAVVDDDAWRRLVDVLGRPVWATKPALATVEGRLAAHDTIDAELGAWTAMWDGPELEAALAAAGIAAGVVQTSGQLLDDPQYRHRNFYRHLEHTEVGTVPYAGHQYRIRGYDHGPRSAAPCLGEHTFEVLTEILGLYGDEVAEIAAADALV